MNHTTLSSSELRRRMKARGVTVSRLASEAGIYPQNLSAYLGGEKSFGDTVRARIEAAIRRLGLDRETQLPDARPAPPEPVFRTR